VPALVLDNENLCAHALRFLPHIALTDWSQRHRYGTEMIAGEPFGRESGLGCPNIKYRELIYDDPSTIFCDTETLQVRRRIWLFDLLNHAIESHDGHFSIGGGTLQSASEH
jgi:hypothetical protein